MKCLARFRSLGGLGVCGNHRKCLQLLACKIWCKSVRSTPNSWPKLLFFLLFLELSVSRSQPEGPSIYKLKIEHMFAGEWPQTKTNVITVKYTYLSLSIYIYIYIYLVGQENSIDFSQFPTLAFWVTFLCRKTGKQHVCRTHLLMWFLFVLGYMLTFWMFLWDSMWVSAYMNIF